MLKAKKKRRLLNREILRAIGMQFKTARLTKNISVNQISADTQIARRTIQNFESGRNAISLPAMFDLADYLDLSIEITEIKKPLN